MSRLRPLVGVLVVCGTGLALTHCGKSFVPLPNDMRCMLSNVTTKMQVANGALRYDYTVEGIGCQVADGPEKSVPLAGTKFVDGILHTKDYGDFKITIGHDQPTFFEVERGKLQALRQFLQR
jgi:hypothetical protein